MSNANAKSITIKRSAPESGEPKAKRNHPTNTDTLRALGIVLNDNTNKALDELDALRAKHEALLAQHAAVTAKLEEVKLIMGTQSAFTDAQEVHRMHPATFYAPSLDAVTALDVGETVKVCHGAERFWTEIVACIPGGFRAKVKNLLVLPQPFNEGDIITFEYRHVFDIACC